MGVTSGDVGGDNCYFGWWFCAQSTNLNQCTVGKSLNCLGVFHIIHKGFMGGLLVLFNEDKNPVDLKG